MPRTRTYRSDEPVKSVLSAEMIAHDDTFKVSKQPKLF